MKCLTVQQPWAWAIFHGKNIENRTQIWKHRGPTAIHAGARLSGRGVQSPLIDAALAEHGGGVLQMGAVLGVVDVVDAHHEEGGCCAPWGEASYVEHGGKVRKRLVHLELANALLFHEPILNVKGRLGIWTPDDDLAHAIRTAVV